MEWIFIMKNITKLFLGISAVAFSQTANAAIWQPPGTYEFTGTLAVEKDLAPLQCDAKLVIVVPNDAPDAHGSFPHGDSATVTAVFTGGDFGCTFIQVQGTATVTGSISGGQEYVTVTGWNIVPPFSSGTCTGAITAEWNDASPAGVSPTEIVLSSPLSDSTATAGAPCKMAGTLVQTSPSTPQLQMTP